MIHGGAISEATASIARDDTPGSSGKARIMLKLFATLSDYLPAGAVRNQVALTVDRGSTVATVIESLNLPPRLVHLVLVNGLFISPTARARCVLQESDALAIWPPIAGG